MTALTATVQKSQTQTKSNQRSAHQLLSDLFRQDCGKNKFIRIRNFSDVIEQISSRIWILKILADVFLA